MARKPKQARLQPTAGARVHLRGRPQLGLGVINSIADNGTWCFMEWDDAFSRERPRIVHINELEVKEETNGC